MAVFARTPRAPEGASGAVWEYLSYLQETVEFAVGRDRRAGERVRGALESRLSALEARLSALEEAGKKTEEEQNG